jgi:hypothetical protein
MDGFARTLVIAGLVFAGLGIVLYMNPSIPLLGKLPGDIRIERPGMRIYLPVTTCLVISLVLSAALWLYTKFR